MNVLWIGHWSSFCGNCNGPVPDLSIKTHETGCGVEFTHVRSQYFGPNEDALTQQCRPDLILIPQIDWSTK